MSQHCHRLSIVCPAYQEEEVLAHFHRELSANLANLGAEYEMEILYVDDGSRDRTLAIIKELAEQDARVRFLSFSRNFGHQAALSAGLDHARGDIVITMDSDLQHPPAVIPTLLEKWREGHDVVLTIRDEDLRLSRFKRCTSRWFYRVIDLLSDTSIRSGASDFRLLSRRAVDSLVQLRETHRFLRGLVQWLGFPSAEVHFRPDPRLAGVSKFTARSMANFALDAILSFSRVPLRLAFLLGFLAVLLGLGHLAYVLSQWAISRPVETSWSLLFVSINFLGGGILCTLGIVGEYVGRIYEQIKARPLYVLKEKSPEGAANDLPESRTIPVARSRAGSNSDREASAA